ncbi:hypothetical protein Tco_1547641 [Tanacetum coccineum]
MGWLQDTNLWGYQQYNLSRNTEYPKLLIGRKQSKAVRKLSDYNNEPETQVKELVLHHRRCSHQSDDEYVNEGDITWLSTDEEEKGNEEDNEEDDEEDDD